MKVCNIATVTAISTLVGTWIVVSECIQGLQDGWQKPWAIVYVIHTQPNYHTWRLLVIRVYTQEGEIKEIF